ncbi:MAG: iron-sulfur cluster repair di-iron protein [Thiobacillaceae bacterium]|jgi:regulator of cell morphogenesis and NO signaling|nr:iron-sulfur cluster repair di-iron protein [Thiobacillaceae bacterium]
MTAVMPPRGILVDDSGMDTIAPETTVGDVVTRHPETLPVFERLGIDYCCGGGRRLDEAVAAGGLVWQDVSAEIGAALAASAQAPAQPSWADAALTDLMGHIIDRYHGKLREMFPMLTQMGEKVINAHGERHPEVREVASTFAALHSELESHMMKEEHVLFPFIEQLESGLGHRHPMLGHIGSPIAMMMKEHDDAGAALATLRAATSSYAAPPDGCATFKGYYDQLALLERELHEHIHLENNILFPRAASLEARVMGR